MARVWQVGPINVLALDDQHEISTDLTFFRVSSGRQQPSLPAFRRDYHNHVDYIFKLIARSRSQVRPPSIGHASLALIRSEPRRWKKSSTGRNAADTDAATRLSSETGARDEEENLVFMA